MAIPGRCSNRLVLCWLQNAVYCSSPARCCATVLWASQVGDEQEHERSCLCRCCNFYTGMFIRKPHYLGLDTTAKEFSFDVPLWMRIPVLAQLSFIVPVRIS